MFRAIKGVVEVEVDYKDDRLTVIPTPARPYYEKASQTIANSLTILLRFYLEEERPETPYTAVTNYFRQHGWAVREL